MPAITEWKEFRIGELFDIRKPKVLHAQQVSEAPEGIPYVVRTKFNNGVKYRVSLQSGMTTSPGGVISFGSENTSFFFQPEPFVSGRDIYYLDTRKRTESQCVFLAACLNRIAGRYTYDFGLFPNLLEQDAIRLPATSSGSPDWNGIERYMRNLLIRTGSILDAMQTAYASKHLIGTTHWKQFPIGELFIVQKGTRLTRATMIPGTTPFIGATLENNGITAHVGNTGHIHPGGTITVAYNGQKATGKAFWQPKPFWASDDVNVLYPQFELTEEIALFLQPLFREAGRPYSFGDKWSVTRMERTPLTLPTQDDGTPDWNRMHRFMRTIMDNAGETIDHLDAIPEPNI